MSQRGAQQGDKPGEPCPGNSILSGASEFSVNQASFVGGNSYKYEGGPTTVQIILDRNVWSGPDPQDGRRSHTSHSQSLDDRFVASESSGHGGTLSKGQFNVPKAELGGIQSDLELRQREIRRRECEIDEWNARKEEFQRSLLEREQAIKQREQDLSVRILELELREEKLQKALTHASERESVVEGKELDVERREVEVNQRYVEVERALKDVEERESVMRMEKRSLAARFTDLKAMEDDIGFRRREEVRKQLGDAAGDLLKYTTIGLQKAFGREAALGVGHVLSHFDFTAIDVGDLKKADGLRAPLVPLYDKINQRQINSMSDGLKVAFAATVGALQASVALKDPHVDWRVVENILTTTPQLQPVGGRVEYREEVEICRELKTSELAIAGQWFHSLLECDGSFHGVTMGVFIKFPDFIPPEQERSPKRAGKPLSEDSPSEKDLLDVTVLWLPGHARRSFKVSHTSIKLRTRQNIARFGRTKRSTILSVEHCLGQTYHPRDSFINEMSETSRRLTMGITERLFDFTDLAGAGVL